ncbi:unnamed protein product [Strongylus vulgaris]|uniref:SSD domain-containing protein n=1 Tax=Strongylus vulgaris TaxID=40348 RepID=A0A3P7JE56_STRVU|nr:unnamed protein product [Strongylus vulgaris]
MCIFCTTTTILSSVTIYNHKATFNKVVLSITACILPFMACGTAFGIVFLLGVTFSPILNVTPFLVILSITACVLPFMACGTAFGIVFLLGVTFSPILNVTPFLVLAISVDDAFLMVHAWNRIEKNDILGARPRPEKMVQVNFYYDYCYYKHLVIVANI